MEVLAGPPDPAAGPRDDAGQSAQRRGRRGRPV